MDQLTRPNISFTLYICKHTTCKNHIKVYYRWKNLPRTLKQWIDVQRIKLQFILQKLQFLFKRSIKHLLESRFLLLYCLLLGRHTNIPLKNQLIEYYVFSLVESPIASNGSGLILDLFFNRNQILTCAFKMRDFYVVKTKKISMSLQSEILKQINLFLS